MRIDQQISPASSSSSSSGLLADLESKRPRRESELEAAVQKLKEMSTTGTKGNNQDNSCSIFCTEFLLPTKNLNVTEWSVTKNA